MATTVITATDLDRFAAHDRDDALHDVIVDYLVNNRIIADPNATVLLVDDPRAHTADHATARLRLAVRQRAHRRNERLATDTARLTNHLTTLDTDHDDDPANHDHDRAATIATIRELVVALPERERIAVEFRYLHDTPIVTIADHLDITEANARKILQRARNHLAAQLTHRGIR